MSKKKKEKRASKPAGAQREARVMEVYELLIDDKTRPEILVHCSKRWGLERASADTLIQDASRIIRADIAAIRDSKLASIIKKQDALYADILATRPMTQNGEQAPNFGAARQVLMDQAKLLGHEKSHVVHSVNEKDEEFEAMTDEELDRELATNDTK